MTDRLPGVRALGVRGHDWRRADLYDCVRDPVARVRLAAVRHPRAADEMLEDATRDPDPEVAAAARAAKAARTEARRIEAERAAAHALRPTPSSPVRAASIFVEPSPAPSPPAREDGLLGKLRRLFR